MIWPPASDLPNLWSYLENRGFRILTLRLHPSDFSSFESHYRDNLHPGHLESLWGASVVRDTFVTQGTVAVDSHPMWDRAVVTTVLWNPPADLDLPRDVPVGAIRSLGDIDLPISPFTVPSFLESGLHGSMLAAEARGDVTRGVVINPANFHRLGLMARPEVTRIGNKLKIWGVDVFVSEYVGGRAILVFGSDVLDQASGPGFVQWLRWESNA